MPEETAASLAKANDVDALARLHEKDAPGDAGREEKDYAVHARDEAGWSPLAWACAAGHIEAVTWLLEHGAAAAEAADGADPDQEARTSSPLHWAAFKGHARVVWMLLTHGAAPDSTDGEKNTPLHLAATGSHLPIVKTLLAQTVAVGAKNVYGNTALELTTNGECRRLLRDASAAANEGRPFLCSCSATFVSAADSVEMHVIDRVSSPTLRPVRYSNECAARIRIAEEALGQAMKAADTAALESAIAEAEAIGASVKLLDEATHAHQRLLAQISLQAQIAQVEGARPLHSRAQYKPLLPVLRQARERDVQADLIEAADRLVHGVDAEVKLADVEGLCEGLVMGEVEAGGDVMSADAPFAHRAEAGMAKLAAAIAAAQSAEAMEEVVSRAEAVHKRLSVESELRKCLLEPKEGKSDEGAEVWEHFNGQTTSSVLDCLQLRNDLLDATLDKCTAEGVLASIVSAAQKAQKTLKADLKQAVIDDEERKAREAAAAAKASKKGKKKK